jgi:HK97 gp10 family phage protein
MEIKLRTDFTDAYAALRKIDDIFEQRKVTQAALRASMKPMLGKAKSRAAKTSGALAESLKIRTFRRGRNLGKNVARAVIYSARKDKKAINKMLNYYGIFQSRVRKGVKHAHLVEFGARSRGGGTIPARPFLRPAFDTGVPAMISAFRRELGKRADKAFKRLRK